MTAPLSTHSWAHTPPPPPRRGSELRPFALAIMGGLLVLILGGLVLGCVALLLHSSADAATCDASDVALVQAVGRQDLRKVTKLLAEGADANARNSDGASPLDCAVDGGDRIVVPHQHDTISPQGQATDVAITRLLLAHGADANGRAANRPLVEALLAKRLQLADVLLPHTTLSKPYAANRVTIGDAALTVAASNGDIPVVRTLLAHGADPNRVPYLSPLLRATFYGQTSAMSLLLTHGADPNIGTADPLVTEVLGAISTSRMNPVYRQARASLAGLAPQVPGALGDPLAGQTLEEPFVATPLGAAAATDDLPAVRLLLRHGANANAVAFDSDDALTIAAKTCDVPIAEALVAAGAKSPGLVHVPLCAAVRPIVRP